MCIKQLLGDLAKPSDAKIKINSHVISLRDDQRHSAELPKAVGNLSGVSFDLVSGY